MKCIASSGHKSLLNYLFIGDAATTYIGLTYFANTLTEQNIITNYLIHNIGIITGLAVMLTVLLLLNEIMQYLYLRAPQQLWIPYITATYILILHRSLIIINNTAHIIIASKTLH